MASTEITIPARVLLQIRDGVPNNVFDFELKVDPQHMDMPVTPEEAAEGATKAHNVSTLSMITGLYGAIAALWKEDKKHYSPEDQTRIYRWFDQMNDWIGELTDRPSDPVVSPLD
jgi:hypothetical protein